MPNITHRSRRPLPRRRRFARLSLYVSAGVVGLFVVANVAIGLIYRERTYPHTKVIDLSVGNIPFAQLAGEVARQRPLPATIRLEHQQAHTDRATAELGIRQDASQLVASAKQQRNWLPISNFFIGHHLAAPIRIDARQLDSAAHQLDATFTAEPHDARLSMADGAVTLTPATPGYRLNHEQLAPAIRAALQQGSTTIAVPVHEIAAKASTKDLQAEQQKLERQLATQLHFTYAGKTLTPSRNDISRWYTPTGQSFTLSESNIISYLTSAGVQSGLGFSDSAQAAASAAKALATATPTTIPLTPVTAAKTITYCTAVKGVSASELPILQAKARTTYADARGWSLGGIVAFKEVASGCDFTLWLTASPLMPTFGEICDSTWSCRVGPNVVINYDRWQHASPAWNSFGGTLDNYRDMVINHETGHWLGFNHATCPGPGQLAPVMQQQSIDLQGCSFNPWPTAGELQADRRNLGL